MIRAPLALAAAAWALSGCVAAVIPLAAAGTIGKKKIDGPKRKKHAAVAVVAAEMPAGRTLTLLPSGSALPPPDGALPAAAPAPEAGWRALVRHVARAMSSGASCPDTAVLIDASVASAEAAERDAAVASLNALRTMGTSVTFVSADPQSARTALRGAGMAEADTKVAAPGDVVGLARTGCVVASGGGTRAAYTGLAWFALPPAASTLAKVHTP